MKLRILLSLTAALLLSMPALAQKPTGAIHGKVLDTAGQPFTEPNSTVGLSQDGGHTMKFSFPVSATGEYKGDGIAPGTYNLFLSTGGKLVDSYENIKIVAGQDLALDDDLSRKAYLDKLTPEQRKQIEQHNKDLKANQVVKNLNADLVAANNSLKEGDEAHASAVKALGASASKADIAAKETEIKQAKYGEAEALMKKDTDIRPNEPALWVGLGNAQSGLGKYDDAIASFKKALELDVAKPNPETEGTANSGLGTAYAKSKKVDDAAAAFDAAAKAVPTKASIYYTNFVKILYTLNSSGTLSAPDAQAAAADKAITATPAANTPAYGLLFYLKAQALTQKASYDEKTKTISLPPGTVEAYQKYLELDPNGQFAEDSKAVLASAGQKVETKYKAKK